MAFFHFKNVRVAGISAGVPSAVINNLTSERRFSKDYDNADFVTTTGVVERRIDQNLTASDLCYKAAKKLISNLNWNANEIDAVIMVSQTLDYVLPATACIMQDRLGCSKDCYAEDIQLGCSGWVYGMSNVAALISNGDIKRALLCAGDGRHHIICPELEDPLFGFAGSVTALEYDEGNDGIKCNFGTDGSGYDAIIRPQGGTRNPIDASIFNVVEIAGKQYNGMSARMKGMDVFSFGISTAPKSVKRLAEKYGFNYLDADYFVFHQANMKMNQLIAKKLKLNVEKVPISMDRYGNTSSASIPLTIVDVFSKNGGVNSSVLDNKTFICCGFGVGLSWGTIYFKANNMLISPIVEVNSDEHML